MSRRATRTRSAPDRLTDAAVTALTVATAGFAMVALARPETLSGDASSAGQRYYGRMYAARALPLAGAVLATAGRGRANKPLLLVAGAAQLADSLIGFARRDVRQGLIPLVGACVYTARAVRRP